MTDLALIQSIESAQYRSWKARECVEYDGWQLRFADGFSRRGNSVYPAEVSTVPLSVKLDFCRDWYRERSLDLVVRQNPATEPGLDERLAAAGFTPEGDTDVMTATIGRRSGGLEVADAPLPDWWATTAALWNLDSDGRRGWKAIIDGVDLPAGFVCVPETAAGLAIVAEEWVGLFEIVVASEQRRQGWGRAVTESLLDWATNLGAAQAYLQVVAANTAAIEFYRSLGFTRAYGYWYRREPPVTERQEGDAA
ncbi:MAG: GNAT family N-acetyltransferase [Acidimicrobiia bacterium]|nr:GNAT family N-acetyltransferase [Acidimicrobiia bacterium]